MCALACGGGMTSSLFKSGNVPDVSYVVSPLYTNVLFSVSSKDTSYSRVACGPSASSSCSQINTAMFSPVLHGGGGGGGGRTRCLHSIVTPQGMTTSHSLKQMNNENSLHHNYSN